MASMGCGGGFLCPLKLQHTGHEFAEPFFPHAEPLSPPGLYPYFVVIQFYFKATLYSMQPFQG
jgi:hypothetical protein